MGIAVVTVVVSDLKSGRARQSMAGRGMAIGWVLMKGGIIGGPKRTSSLPDMYETNLEIAQ